MAANSALDKKLRRAIGILEGNPPQRSGIPTPRRHKDPLVEACHEVRKVLADEEYWPKTYTSRALNGLFDVLDKDDANLRILADQCLNCILRKFLTKGQTSRTLAILLNELGRKASARGFVAALTMLESTLRYAKEARLPVYAMHLLNSLKEAIKRPEQAVQGVIEQLFAPIFEYFKNDLNDSHYNYVDSLTMQGLENLQLPGVSNRAASAVLAGIFENFPRIRAKIVCSLLDTLRSAEEINDKNQLVGAFNTFKKLWKDLDSSDVIHSVLYRVLCSLRTQSSEIQTAALELLDVAISSTSLETLKFQPASFTDSENRRGSIAESLGNLSINEKDLSFDVDEGATMSRFNSVNSLEESLPPSARSEVSEEDVFNNASDDEDTNSGRTSKSGPEIDTDPLFRRSSPSEYLLDNVEEPEVQESPLHSAHEAIDGPLCAELPKTRLESTANFLDHAACIILSKFLFTGTPGELKSDAEVRVSIKVLALKVLAAISAVYYKINELIIGQQNFADIQILIQNSDDAVSVRCFEVLTNLETEMIRKATKTWPITPPTKFSIHLNQLTGQPNPMKLKDLFQVLNKAHMLLQADQNTLKSVLNLAIETFECDYFLLKVVRAEFLAHIKWDSINPAIREGYQRKCFQLLIKSLFDSDYRVASAVSELLPVAVKNAEFSQLSNTFNCQWPEEMAAPSFAYQPQVFALHPNYSFRGDCPDLVLEHSLTTTIAMLYEEVSTRSSDFSHFVQGLLKLAEQFSPCVYGQAWACQDNKSQRSILDIVLEQTDGFTTNPSDFINALRLISQIFCGLMENSLSQYANQPKEKDFLQGNAILDQVITVYLRVLNLYFTVIRENTTKISSTMSSPLFTKRNWVQGGVNSSANENRSYSISHLVGTGVHPTRPTSYTQSASLKRIEPLIRGAFSNFQSSLKKQTEERFTILLNTALDGLSALLELTSREIMNSFIDELFIYIRTLMHFSLAPVTKVVTQLLKNIFDKNAFHINSNTLVSLRLKNAVMPNDPLEMYIGRSINNFSVYLAFLDRSEHFTLHQLRHFGWMNKTIGSPVAKRSANHALEIGARLEQFERFVTFLMHAFLNNSQMEIRENILSLLGVLVTNDVRYDKLDPQSRIWKSVLQFIRHPTLKYVEESKNLFTFVCLVTRVIDVSFEEVIILMGKCLEKLDKTNVDDILDALHVVILEAVGYYVKVPQSLIDLLKQENTSLFSISPAKTIQLWTLMLHWARTTQPDLFYRDLSTNFVNELRFFFDKNGFKTFKNRKMAFEIGNSIIIGLKTCHPNTFKPINNIAEMLIKSLDVGWIESLPFMSFLLCRIDLDIVLVQMKDVIDEPVEKLSGVLSQLLLSALDEIFESAENLEPIEEALSFFQVSLLHIFRANPAFHKQFKILISDALRQKDFIQKVLRISFLAPKVYGTFMTILVQLDYFDKEIGKLYYASCLPYNAKQLSTLLLIQKATDRRASASLEFEDFLLSLPQETTVRFVKMLTEKQILTVKERFNKENVEKIVGKCREYLRNNPIPALEYGLNLLTENDGIRSENAEKTVELSPEARKHKNLIDGINQKSSITIEDDLDCLAQMALQMEKAERIGVVEAISDIFRPTLLTKIFEYLNDELRKVVIENYRIDKMRDSNVLMKFVDEFVYWISNNYVNARDVQAVLNGISRIPSEFEEFQRIRIQNFDRILNNGFVIDMIESDLSGYVLQAEFYTALTELMKRSDLTPYDNNDQFCIENLSNFLSMTIDQLERQIPKTDRLKIDKNWKLVISGEDENDEILEAFFSCQKAAHILQMKKVNVIANEHFEEVKKAILSMLRLNVFSKMFLFPQKALVRGVALQIEPHTDKIFVPMISIHLLSDFEILSDFLQRIFLLGWTKKSQFEEIWMSLFGVLCSTPIGNELQGEDVQQIVDQLSASTLAVEALTGMLTMSLLYPTPGDTVNSRFMIKTRQTRDSYLFLNSLNGRKAAISRTQVENSFNPAQIFSANLEKLSSTGLKYGLAQTSVYYLWSITGELEPTNKKPNGMPKSVSDYLIQASTDLDTVSSLKSLIENFFHWFENGYKALPLPLLAATIKSIALLSDMFDDIQLYVRVYGYLKEIYVSFYLQNHPAQGLLNYCILKFAAIVDLERLDPDSNEARKIIDNMIADTQEQEDRFVLNCTLYGLLYLLQSVIVDEFQQQLKGVGEKVLGKLERIHSNYDLIHEGELETIEHQKLLWTVIFRISEQFGRGDSEFDQRFLKLTKTVLMDPRVTTSQKNIVSNGIQALVCHSASFAEAFRDCAVELFDTYQLRPNHLSMTLSVYFTCVYRSIQDNERFAQQEMDQFRQEFQKILNLFSYYTLKSEIQRFLPPIAELFLIFFPRNELFDTIFALISMDDKSETIGDYDRCLYHLLHYALQRSAKEKPKETVDFVRFFLLEKVHNVKSRRISRHLKALVMVSVGYSKEARLLFPQLLRRNPDIDGVYNKATEVFIEKATSLNIKLGDQESSLLN